jgi:hypothetical protein
MWDIKPKEAVLLARSGLQLESCSMKEADVAQERQRVDTVCFPRFRGRALSTY